MSPVVIMSDDGQFDRISIDGEDPGILTLIKVPESGEIGCLDIAYE